MRKIRTYSELIRLKTFEERYEYLRLAINKVGEDTFGFERYLNQQWYKTAQWYHIRDQVIIRDNGCDLGLIDYPIYGRIIIHHLHVLTEEDIINRTSYLTNPEYLVCCSLDTHNAIHYGTFEKIDRSIVERSAKDTMLW